jgi:hypothetical protein
MTKMSLQTDLEIYLFNANPKAIKDWLCKHFEMVDFDTESNKSTINGCVHFEGIPILIKFYPKAMGNNVSSLWIETSGKPWKDDLECARSASQTLGVEVRCAKNNWQEGDNADSEWWQIKENSEKLIVW